MNTLKSEYGFSFLILQNKSFYLQIILYLTINSLFIFKYVSRTSIYPSLVFLFYILCLALFTFLGNLYIGKFSQKATKILYWIFVLLVIGLIHFIHMKIDPMSIQVDRWSAINNFITSLFQGNYPYLAKTHLGGYGSPFPAWQIFHIPFYLLGDVGIGISFVFLGLAFILIRVFNNTIHALIYLLLLVTSPAFWYEVLVRSDLMYNFILCFGIIAIINRKNILLKDHSIGLGIICGLFLSTRLSIVLPFAIFLFSDFWYANFKIKMTFILSALITFIATFLPLLIWNHHELLTFEYNPFVLQSRQGSFYEVLLLLVLILFFSFKWKENMTKCFSYIGLSIIVFVGATFLHRMILDDFSNGLFSSRYDITYSNMALPFIIYVISVKLNVLKPSRSLD